MSNTPTIEVSTVEWCESLNHEHSSWQGLRNYPDTVTARNMERLVDWAVANPEAWRVIRLRLRFPAITQARIAEMLGISQQTVSRHLAIKIELEDYPKPENDMEDEDE